MSGTRRSPRRSAGATRHDGAAAGAVPAAPRSPAGATPAGRARDEDELVDEPGRKRATRARRRPATPEIVRDQVVLEELDLSPDGSRAAVVRRTVEATGYRRELLLVPLDPGGVPRPITAGRPGDTHPRFSPDGRQLAFLSARAAQVPPADPAGPRQGASPAATAVPAASADAPAQVWILPLEGGEPWRLTAAELGVTGYAWSPDGTLIAWWGPAEEHRLAGDPVARGEEPVARRIVGGTFRWDEVGYLDHRTHLRVAEARAGSSSQRLTEGDWDVIAPAWDAGGRSLVFCAARHAGADLYPRPSVWRVSAPAAGGGRSHRGGAGSPRDDATGGTAPVEVCRLAGLVESAIPSPDGRWLALIGVDVPGAPDDAAPSLFVVPSDGPAPPAALAPDLDLPAGVWLDTDLTGWSSAARPGPWWVRDPDGTALVALVSRAGRCVPWRFPVTSPEEAGSGPAGTGMPGPTAGTKRPRPLVEADAACLALAVAGGRIAVLGTLGGRAMEVMTVERGGLRTRTSVGSAWQRRCDEPRMADLAIPGEGGAIETWLASPSFAGTGPLPLVVDLHGGPLGAWAPAASLEVRILASHGFRVALPNIRGSAGYGASWIRPHMGHWGGPDAADALAVVDHLVGTGLADPGRVGLLGLSYGGFLVNWLVGVAPGRFAAAVSENGVTNQLAAWALSDSGPDYTRRASLGDPLTPEGVELLWRQSPLRNVAAIRTPLLLLQGDADVRCPAADNLQLFLALRALGRIVEYVAYPGSWHTFSVTGRPDRRIDRHRRMLDWFRRYLG